MIQCRQTLNYYTKSLPKMSVLWRFLVGVGVRSSVRPSQIGLLTPKHVTRRQPYQQRGHRSSLPSQKHQQYGWFICKGFCIACEGFIRARDSQEGSGTDLRACAEARPSQLLGIVYSTSSEMGPILTRATRSGSAKKCLQSVPGSRRTRCFTTSPHLQVAPVGLSSTEGQAAQKYCADLVRKYDSPSFTLSHFVQPHALPAYLAIRAFNIEISRIPDIVSNTTIGQMRHQFWRDTINKTFNSNPPEEPVAILLASYMQDSGIKLNKTWFQKVISAREEALTRPGFTNVAAVETYAESTYSMLLYLTLSALPLNSLAADHVASHIGKAAGITTILRGVPLLAFPPAPNSHSVNPPGMGLAPTRDRHRIINLPYDVLSRAGVQEEDVFRNGASAAGLKDAVFEVATRASDHLITARSLLKDIKANQEPDHSFEHQNDEGHDYQNQETTDPTQEGRRKDLEKAFGVVMGPAVSTQLWLDRLQKVDFDIFDVSLRTTDWKLPFIAWTRQKQVSF